MSHFNRRGLLACVALAMLTGCEPEGFAVTPCLLNEKLAFGIHRIDGWFTDYQPRPTSVLVLEEYHGDDFWHAVTPYRWPGLWSAELKNYGDQRAFEKRPTRKLITYGQRLEGWEVAQFPKPLTKGKDYSVLISDSGRRGSAKVTAGRLLPPCS